MYVAIVNFSTNIKKMVNGSYICNYHGLTTNPTNMGCYQIQKSKNRTLFKN